MRGTGLVTGRSLCPPGVSAAVVRGGTRLPGDALSHPIRRPPMPTRHLLSEEGPRQQRPRARQDDNTHTHRLRTRRAHQHQHVLATALCMARLYPSHAYAKLPSRPRHIRGGGKRRDCQSKHHMMPTHTRRVPSAQAQQRDTCAQPQRATHYLTQPTDEWSSLQVKTRLSPRSVLCRPLSPSLDQAATVQRGVDGSMCTSRRPARTGVPSHPMPSQSPPLSLACTPHVPHCYW
jgi:hypothetical protein